LKPTLTPPDGEEKVTWTVQESPSLIVVPKLARHASEPPLGSEPPQVVEVAVVPLHVTLAPLTCASTLPMFLSVKTTVDPSVKAPVTSIMGWLVALLVVVHMNQATNEAATTALMVISTVTMGGTPPNLLPRFTRTKVEAALLFLSIQR